MVGDRRRQHTTNERTQVSGQLPASRPNKCEPKARRRSFAARCHSAFYHATHTRARAAASAVAATTTAATTAATTRAMTTQIISIYLADNSPKHVRVDAGTTVQVRVDEAKACVCHNEAQFLQRIVHVVLEGLNMDRYSFGNFALRLISLPTGPGSSGADGHWLHSSLRLPQVENGGAARDRSHSAFTTKKSSFRSSAIISSRLRAVYSCVSS